MAKHDGEHTHTISNNVFDGGGGSRTNAWTASARTYAFGYGNSVSNSSGNHTHELVIDKGGDIETRPKNGAVFYYIKIN